jgi:very-short-patch-repair endonuclease
VDEATVVRVAAEHQGVPSWRQLRSRLSRRQIEAAVRDGTLVRLGRGTYALAGAGDPLQAAGHLGGCASHESAARLWFLETLHEPRATHVTLPRGRRPRYRRGAVVHWSDLEEHEVRGRVTSPLRTVLDCARTLPFAEALAIADSALRRGLLERDELVAAAVASSAPGVRAARRVLEAADGRADNPFESGLRAVVLEEGIEGFVPQLPFRVPGASGFVDLGDPRRRIVLEAEGFEFHGTRQALHRDCRRYTALGRAGWVVLRFSWEDVLFDTDWVAASVRDVVAGRDARGNRRDTGG